MEWNSSALSNSLKDHRTTRVPFNNNNNNNNNNNSNNNNNNGCNKLKDSWSYNGGDQDYLNGFSWPPRSYTCSFCKREFRSAQALGGHMNVHRRDRARLRQSPPPPPPSPPTSRDGQCNNNNNPLLNLNPNPNPNPSFPPPPPFISCSKPTTLASSSCSTLSALPSSSSSPSPLCSPSDIKKWNGSSFARMGTQKSFFCVKEFDGLKKDRCKFLKKGENINVRLDLEIGPFSNYSNPKEELDLELRLGYS